MSKIPQINHQDRAESRLASQYNESENLIGYIRALVEEDDSLEQVFQDVLYKRSIDEGEGVQLDILGSLIGQPRELVDAAIIGYFGFQSAPSALGFGTVGDPTIGGRYRSLGEPTNGTRVLSDEEYRVYLRARAKKNNTRSTVEDIIELITFILNSEQVVLVEGETSYSVSIGKVLSDGEKAFITQTDLIPKTLGVGVTYQEHDPSNFFGFEGVPNAEGYGILPYVLSYNGTNIFTDPTDPTEWGAFSDPDTDFSLVTEENPSGVPSVARLEYVGPLNMGIELSPFDAPLTIGEDFFICALVKPESLNYLRLWFQHNGSGTVTEESIVVSIDSGMHNTISGGGSLQSVKSEITTHGYYLVQAHFKAQGNFDYRGGIYGAGDLSNGPITVGEVLKIQNIFAGTTSTGDFPAVTATEQEKENSVDPIGGKYASLL